MGGNSQYNPLAADIWTLRKAHKQGGGVGVDGYGISNSDYMDVAWKTLGDSWVYFRIDRESIHADYFHSRIFKSF